MKGINFFTAAIAAALVLPATGQNFNIDINALPGTVPPPTYGAYAGIPGVWNDVPITVFGQTLNYLSGAPSPATIDVYSGNPLLGTVGGIPAPFTELYEDHVLDTGTINVDINNVEAGQYAIVVYAYRPLGSINCYGFSSSSGPTPNVAINCDPTFPAQGFVVGRTLATVIPIPVSSTGETISLRIIGIEPSETFLSAIQVFKTYTSASGGPLGCIQPPNSTFMPGVPGSGEPNLFATGTGNAIGPFATSTDIRVHVGIGLPTGLPTPGPVIQGWVSNNLGSALPLSCPFVGSRCIIALPNSPLLRVPDTNGLVVPGQQWPNPTGPGTAGQSTAFGTYVVGLNLSDLGAAGLNVMAGTSLYFQFVYRDYSDYTICPGPDPMNPMQGAPALVRYTRSLEVQLQ